MPFPMLARVYRFALLYLLPPFFSLCERLSLWERTDRIEMQGYPISRELLCYYGRIFAAINLPLRSDVWVVLSLVRVLLSRRHLIPLENDSNQDYETWDFFSCLLFYHAFLSRFSCVCWLAVYLLECIKALS